MPTSRYHAPSPLSLNFATNGMGSAMHIYIMSAKFLGPSQGAAHLSISVSASDKTSSYILVGSTRIDVKGGGGGGA